MLNQLAGVDLLILDDLAAEQSSSWAADTLYLVVNTRYENLRAVMITANFSLKLLQERVGDRVVSRLWASSVVVDLSGEDYRAKLRGK